MSNLEKFVAAGVVKADTVTEQEKAVIAKLSPQEGEAMLRLRQNRDTNLVARESGNIIGPFAGQ
jgi:hypothetical protein